MELILHVLASRTVGGRLNFTVPLIGMPVRLGTNVTKRDTHEIDINLAPPSRDAGEEVR